MSYKKSNINRLVILGSNSFIASSLKKICTENKVEILLISRKEINLNLAKTYLKLDKILKPKDTVVFIAAAAPVKNLTMLNYNLSMCENILKSLNKIKNLNHLIYVSSDAVYSDSKKKLTEKSQTVPNSLHGFMHLIRENMLKNLDCPKSFVRPTLVYGENDPHNGYGPNQFIRNAQNSKNIVLFGKGEERRDHINVNDVGHIIYEIAKNKITGVINAVSGNLVSFHDIAKDVKKIYPKIKIKYIKRNGPMPHNGYRAFDNSLLKRKFKGIALTKLSHWIKKKNKYKLL